MDPLVAAAYYNITASPLCRLPDELLLEIMAHADELGFHCLRQTSRVFLRLSSSRDVTSMDQSSLWYQFPWPLDKEPWPHSLRQPQLATLLRKDRYCSRCLDVRKLGSEHEKARALVDEQLYCATCKIPRPAALFSTSERRSEASDRACIEHQGHIRPCQHVVIRWSDIESWLIRYNVDAIEDGQLICPSSITCHAASHGFHSGKGAPYDCISREVRKGYDNNVELRFTWSPHVATLPGSTIPTAEVMRRVAERVHQDAGQFFTSRTSHSYRGLMGSFDPNKCSCVRYNGRDRLDWQLSPIRDAEFGCRTYASDDPHSPTVRYYDACSSNRNHFVYRSMRESYAKWLSIYYFLSIDIKFDLATLGRAPTEWYKAMDPESYLPAMDADSCHVLWCLDKNCGNFYRKFDPERFRHILGP